MSMLDIKPFFDTNTNTVTYAVTDIASKQTAIIDPVLDFDANSGTLSSQNADDVIAYLDKNNFTLEWLLETHVHADHISASNYIQSKRGGLIGISTHITKVQSTFCKLFNNCQEIDCKGEQFDCLFDDGEVIKLGHLDIQVIHTPGHTPACASYKIEDAVFVGDTIFMPDFGTARTDFPSGSAKSLYHSIQQILSLPNNTRIFVGHDYKSETRDEYAWETTVYDEKASNIHIKQGTSEQAFINMRNARDKTLMAPRLLLPSIQINMQAGKLPTPEENGKQYLKLPLNLALS
ncbi:MBL fold metallo-hydrolase [Glaciecola sp. XM2]|jgi:glyoxylase-like metal-dependent hydrolase (beta-lactamase superfamily II)|uniref:MBL fold metallo-hydrolase n=1 Tax=Glaciecola sp. XM2 TaxID=1914931 RepID=UPI001BDDF093|nr:MBL fold metallo-hydrolase [Glaciecola sp. XM2]MBT1450079.1 MBL fold metallo-hydrolase [Glaciecola sp. XM2]